MGPARLGSPAARHLGVVLVVSVVLVAAAACGGDGDDTGAAAGAAVAGAGPTTATATAEELADLDLTPALLRARDFPDPEAVEPILVGADFGAVGPGQRIKVCGQAIRADVGADRGRFSQFRVDRYAITQTVTALPEPQATALGQRFAALGRTCTEPWTQPDPNGGEITRRIVGPVPLPDLGADAAAYLVRAENRLGRDDSILLMVVDGPYVSTLTVTGPVDDRFELVESLELALAERLRALPAPAGEA